MIRKGLCARPGIGWTLLLGLLGLLLPAATAGHDPKEKSGHAEPSSAHVHAAVPAEYARQSPADGLWTDRAVLEVERPSTMRNARSVTGRGAPATALPRRAFS